MIATDTNIIIRLLTQDDAAQYRLAFELFKTEKIFIPDTVVLETEWVLRYAYDYLPDRVVNALRLLFGLPNVVLENPLRVAEALEWHAQGLDFADALHIVSSREAISFVTFDKKLTNRAKELVDLPVVLL